MATDVEPVDRQANTCGEVANVADALQRAREHFELAMSLRPSYGKADGEVGRAASHIHNLMLTVEEHVNALHRRLMGK